MAATGSRNLNMRFVTDLLAATAQVGKLRARKRAWLKRRRVAWLWPPPCRYWFFEAQHAKVRHGVGIQVAKVGLAEPHSFSKEANLKGPTT